MPRQPHDRFFKALLQTPEVALALFRALLPQGLLEGVAPEDLRREDAALTGAGRSRTPDHLYVARRPDGTRLRVLVEHQTRPDPDMDLRLLDELLTLCRHRSQGRRSTPLPPVISVVVYQGRAPWTAPLSLGERFRYAPSTRPILEPLIACPRYLLLDLHRTASGDLPDHPALRMGLALLRCAHTRDPWPTLLQAAHELRALAASSGGDALALPLTYAAEIARHPPPPGFGRDLATAAGYTLEEVFMSYASQLRREGRLEGRHEGRQEGHREGRHEGEIVGQRRLLTRLLERRFGALSPAHRTRIDAATLDEISTWTDDLLTATSPDQLLGTTG